MRLDHEKTDDGLSRRSGLWRLIPVHLDARNYPAQRSTVFDKAHTALCTQLKTTASWLRLCGLRTAGRSIADSLLLNSDLNLTVTPLACARSTPGRLAAENNV